METLTLKLHILDKRTPGRLFNSLDLFCGQFVTFWRPGHDFCLVLEVPKR